MLLKRHGTGLNTSHISKTWILMKIYNIYKIFSQCNSKNQSYFLQNNKNNLRIKKFWNFFQLWQLWNRSENVPYLTYCSSSDRKFCVFLLEFSLNSLLYKKITLKLKFWKIVKIPKLLSHFWNINDSEIKLQFWDSPNSEVEL